MKNLALLVTLSCLPLIGCASSDMPGRSAQEMAGNPNYQNYARRDALRTEIRNQPTNPALHFEHGKYLIAQGSYADLVLARVAFSTAARLAPDWWEPELGLAAVEAKAGDSRTALGAVLRAAQKRGDVDALSLPIALAAYKAGYFELSAAAWARARTVSGQAGPAADAARTFLEQAFSGPGVYETAQLTGRLQGSGETAATEATPNVTIDAYIIKQSRSTTSSAGLNLLESLQLQFGATLINQSYEKTAGTGGREISRNLSVSIPTVTYALQIAQTNETTFNLESSPSVVATEGQLSRFFEGKSITIIAAGSAGASSTQTEKDIGVDLQVTPVKVSADYVDLSATLDVSELSANSFSSFGIQTLQTDTTTTQSNARVPFGRALAIGLGASTMTYDGKDGVPYLKNVPGLGYLAGTRSAGETRQETVVLIAVSRDDSEPANEPIDEAMTGQQLFSSGVAAPERVARLPSQAPAPDYLAWLPGPQ